MQLGVCTPHSTARRTPSRLRSQQHIERWLAPLASLAAAGAEHGAAQRLAAGLCAPEYQVQRRREESAEPGLDNHQLPPQDLQSIHQLGAGSRLSTGGALAVGSALAATARGGAGGARGGAGSGGAGGGVPSVPRTLDPLPSANRWVRLSSTSTPAQQGASCLSPSTSHGHRRPPGFGSPEGSCSLTTQTTGTPWLLAASTAATTLGMQRMAPLTHSTASGRQKSFCTSMTIRACSPIAAGRRRSGRSSHSRPKRPPDHLLTLKILIHLLIRSISE